MLIVNIATDKLRIIQIVTIITVNVMKDDEGLTFVNDSQS